MIDSTFKYTYPPLETKDNSVDTFPNSLIFPNGSLTDNGDGTTTVSFTSVLNNIYLKLNQTTPQTVTNGAPIFNEGLRSNGAIILKSGQRLIFDGA